jgi:hypothetical protein
VVLKTKNDLDPARRGFFSVGSSRVNIYDKLESEDMSSTVGATTIGPVEHSVRDRVAEYRDENGHPNYNTALQAMLEEVDVE